MRNNLRTVLVLATVVYATSLAIACQQAAPAPPAAPAAPKAVAPTAAATAAPAAAAPTKAPAAAAPTKAPAAAAPTAAPSKPPEGFVPSRPVEFVVFASPGGGSSVFAEVVGGAMEKNKIVPVPLPRVHKPGGSQTVGMAYLLSKKGSDYHWGSVSIPSHLTAGLTGGAEMMSHKDFTDIALLAVDQNLITVRYDSPHKTLKDLIDAAKVKPKNVKAAGALVGGLDSILIHMLGKAAGVEFNYIAFQSGGDVTAALLGGHVDFQSGQPAETYPQVEGKQMRILAVASDKRMPRLPDVPTLKELGYDVVIQAVRGIVGPPGMTEAARKYYEAAAKQVADTPEFKKYCDDNMLTAQFMDGPSTRKFSDDYAEKLFVVLRELGIVKK